ncbi:DUF4394 domain-containing protein [Yinghuangia sp. YIM S09857]|uniref:DUF4394 domain-containing protein n=1 Tax=Yinghuangia sp. YIM S09857 TaxID=3436929 RepID=UPI003F5397F1
MRKTVMAAAAAAALAASIPTVAWAGGDVGGGVGRNAEDNECKAGKGGGHRTGHTGLRVVGLTEDQCLVAFDTREPGHVKPVGKVTGLAGDSRLVGIDFRVQDGKLYGIGDAGGIYTVDTAAVAAKVSQLSIALSGTHFGVDFNPAADRLRVISDTGQNLRHNVAEPTGTTANDGTLTNPTMPPSTAMEVTGAGYTNNDLNPATATTLFDIDTANDRVSIQSPANAGNLAPTGNLGVDAGPSAGFDVYYSPADGTNQGYAALRTSNGYGFYTVNLLNGSAQHVGAFPGDHQVFDVALPLADN